MLGGGPRTDNKDMMMLGGGMIATTLVFVGTLYFGYMMYGPQEPNIEGDPSVLHPYRRSILDTIIPPVPTISTFTNDTSQSLDTTISSISTTSITNGAQGRRTKLIG
ncbi:hypothetical protein FSST1_006343 [Fusarium sambucinum]